MTSALVTKKFKNNLGKEILVSNHQRILEEEKLGKEGLQNCKKDSKENIEFRSIAIVQEKSMNYIRQLLLKEPTIKEEEQINSLRNAKKMGDEFTAKVEIIIKEDVQLNAFAKTSPEEKEKEYKESKSKKLSVTKAKKVNLEEEQSHSDWVFKCFHFNSSTAPFNIAAFVIEDPKARAIFKNSALCILLSKERNMIIVRFYEPKHRHWVESFSFVESGTLMPLHLCNFQAIPQADYYFIYRATHSHSKWLRRDLHQAWLESIAQYMDDSIHEAQILSFDAKIKKCISHEWFEQICRGKSLEEIIYYFHNLWLKIMNSLHNLEDQKNFGFEFY